MQRIDMGSKNGRFITVCSLAQKITSTSMPLGNEELLYKNMLVLFCQRNKEREGLFWDKGCLRPPSMATSEGWRGPLKGG